MEVGAVADVLENVLAARRTAPCRSTARPRRPCASGTRSRGRSARAWPPCRGSRCRRRRPGLRAAAWTGCAGSRSRSWGSACRSSLAWRAAISRNADAAPRWTRAAADSRASTLGDASRDRARLWPEPAPRLLVVLADDRWDARARCRAPRATAVPGSCASLRSPGWFRGPRANSATKRGSSGNVMPNFAMRMPQRFQFLAPDAEIAQGLHQIVIRLARGGDAETRALAAPNIWFTPVQRGRIRAQLRGAGNSPRARVCSVNGIDQARVDVLSGNPRECGSPSRSGSTSTVPPPSQTLVTIFIADPGAGKARERDGQRGRSRESPACCRDRKRGIPKL